MNAKITNEVVVGCLKLRRQTINELLPVQNNPDVRYLLQCELTYVEAMIQYREKYGGEPGIVLNVEQSEIMG